MSPSLVTLTADPFRGPPVCGSQRSANPLTVGHTVRVSHKPRIPGSPLMITLVILPLMITPAAPSVDDHATGDCNVRQTHWLDTVRVSHRLWITVDDHSLDHSVEDHATLILALRSRD